MGSLLWHPHPCTRFDLGVDEMKSKEIFQNNFPEEFFNKIFQQNFLKRIQGNFLAFDYALKNLIKLEVSHEEAKEDPRTKYSDYPSA